MFTMAAVESGFTLPSTYSLSPSPHLDRSVQWQPATPSQSKSHTSVHALDDSSLPDKENTPIRVQHGSNRATSLSPARGARLTFSPMKQQLSFTPRRGKPLLRAWERRPATPFVPRNEGQRIWKRIPLGELAGEVNRHITKGEKDEMKNYVRIVKKLKLDSGTASALTDENIEAFAGTEFVGTKWTEENIEQGGSPKKKSRIEQNPDVMSSPRDIPASENQPEESAALDLQETINGNHEQMESELGKSVIESEESIQVEIQDQQLSEGMQAYGEEDQTTATAPVSALLPASGTGASDALLQDGRPQPLMDEIAEDVEPLTSGLTTMNEGQSLIEPTAGQDLCNPEGELNLSLTSHIAPTEDRGEGDIFTSNAEDSTINQSQTTTAVAVLTWANSTFASPDHDEAEFLRDFLQRSQASRAAKALSSPSKDPTLPSPFTDPERLNLDEVEQDNGDEVEEAEDDDLSPPIQLREVEPIYDASTTIPNSPTRRSTRMSGRVARTRLPRFQPQSLPPVPHFGPVVPSQNAPASLPNTIQLKRATGCEFIFNAKEQQTISMMTRANTKKNQGSAIHVNQRLAQLKKELEVLNGCEDVGSEQVPLQVSHSIPDGDKIEDADNAKTSGKRKRVKNDAGKAPKVKRSVTWPSDEELVKYREASPITERLCLDNFDNNGFAPAASELDVVAPTADCESLSSAEASNTATVVDTKSKEKEEREDASKLKVRRIRKIKLDSVNGTPAPKTRSRSIADLDEAEPETCATTDGKEPSVAKAATRRSSRMPIPVPKPIPLSSLTKSAKPKTRSADREQLQATSTSKIANNSIVDESAAEPDKTSSEVDRRLDGRRRLRAKRS